MKKMRNNKKGFTLIEMIVVIVIIAILVALAVPAVMGYVNDARVAKLEAAGHSGTVTMQAAMAKAEAKLELNADKYKKIKEEGVEAAGDKASAASACIVYDKGDDSCKTEFTAGTHSLDQVTSYVFKIDTHVVVVTSDGTVSVDPKADEPTTQTE